MLISAQHYSMIQLTDKQTNKQQDLLRKITKHYICSGSKDITWTAKGKLLIFTPDSYGFSSPLASCKNKNKTKNIKRTNAHRIHQKTQGITQGSSL